MKVSGRLIVIAALFVTCLITANIIAVKIISVSSLLLPAAIIVFPLSYIFGDILTEVYGYKMARRVIWLGFLCNLVFVAFAWVGLKLPPASFWEGQTAYETILGYAPRLLLASFAGYLVGEFSNSYILARFKVATQGRFLWLRTISSTIVGEGLDSVIFLVVAFAGTPALTPTLVLSHWLVKTGIEVAATPATYAIVNFLKRRDEADFYDSQTNFNPFSIRG